jgi:hypothetical protein
MPARSFAAPPPFTALLAFVLASLAAITAVLVASPELRDLVSTLVERLRSLLGIE